MSQTPRKLLFIDTAINAAILTVNTAPSFATGNGIFVTTPADRPSNCPSDQELVMADGQRLLVSTRVNANNNLDFALLRYRSDGLLDNSFGNQGIVATAISKGNDVAHGLAVQADGKIVVVGWCDGVIGGDDIALVRYNSNGTLDTRFSGDGKLTTDFRGFTDQGASVALQQDGKIVVAGSSNNGHDDDFALVRYNPDGSLDSHFGQGGKLGTDFSGGSDFANHVQVLANGKLMVLGSSASTVGQGFDFALARYNSDGSLDSSFSGDGKLTTDLSGWNDQAVNMAVQADGKLVVVGSVQPAGSSYTNIAIIRYNSDGSVDGHFGSNGKVITDLSPNGNDSADSVTVQADGKILVIGHSNYQGKPNSFTMLRYNSNGTLDTGFDKVNTLDGYPHYLNDGGIPFINLDDHSIPTYTENYSPVAMDADVDVSDTELDAANNYNGASVTLVRHGGANSDDQFFLGGYQHPYFTVNSVVFNNVAVASYTQSAGRLSIYFNAHATANSVDRVLQTLSYRNVSDTPPSSVQIDWIFNDGNTGAQGTGGALTVLGATTVKIVATNDAPVLVTPPGIYYTDTAFDDSFATVTGKLNASDVDNTVLTYGIIGGVANGNGTISKAGAYGLLTVTKATGAYSFVANDAALEALTVNAALDFTVSVSDGSLVTSKTLTVNVSQDGITESNGNDNLLGTSGNDKFNGLAGADTMTGGLGNDTYTVDNIGDKVVETSVLVTEIDRVNSSVDYTLSVNVEILVLIGAALTGAGNAAPNVLIGNAANNTLSGGAGNDAINGGLGSDRLTGGAGQDRFIFNTAPTVGGIDTITDFVVADDTVQLDKAIFTKLTTTGWLDSGYFKIGTAAADANDFIIYHQATGGLFYDADGNGAGAAVQIANVGSNLVLTNADFWVV